MLMSDIATRAREIVNDPTGVRWSDAELMRWAGDGQLFIVNYRPDATATSATLTLIAGTKQSLAATHMRLLDVTRALNANDTIAGIVRYVDRHILDSMDPLWHSRKSSLIIKNVVYDNRIPKEFYCSPPATAGAKIEAQVCVKPTDPTALTDTLSIIEAYREMLVNYVVFRCYCKDTEARQDRAQLFLSALGQGLGIKLQKDMAFQPDLNNKGGSPNSTAISAGAA